MGRNWFAWREAWSLRGDNPLPKLWRAAEARRARRRSWWQAPTGADAARAGASAVATYLLWLVLQEFLSVRHSAVASVAFAHGLALAGVQIFIVALAAFCLCWLLSRVYAMTYFTLALLGRERRKDFAGLDEAVLASGISDEQVVLAVVLHAWRMIIAPLLAFSACSAALYCIWLVAPTAMALDQSSTAPGPAPFGQALLLALELLVLQTSGSLAGTALLALILLMLGRGTGPFAPTFGGVSMVLLQCLLAFAMVTSSAWINVDGEPPLAWWWVLLAGALALALFVFIFWVAHRSTTWRTICAPLAAGARRPAGAAAALGRSDQRG